MLKHQVELLRFPAPQAKRDMRPPTPEVSLDDLEFLKVNLYKFQDLKVPTEVVDIVD